MHVKHYRNLDLWADFVCTVYHSIKNNILLKVNKNELHYIIPGTYTVYRAIFALCNFLLNLQFCLVLNLPGHSCI